MCRCIGICKQIKYKYTKHFYVGPEARIVGSRGGCTPSPPRFSPQFKFGCLFSS
uniref:Uncharacterized protein n=1 Tax=Arundo donax TaxID=35708 RepID=A0A0A8YGA6_ARUDO